MRLVSSRKTSTARCPLRERHEVRSHHLPPSAETSSPLDRDGRGLAPPGLEQVEQPRGDLVELGPGVDGAAGQQPGGGLVDEADPVAGVHHRIALAQVLDDEAVQVVEVGEVDVALADQRLALAQAARERDREQRDQEQARPGEAAVRKAAPPAAPASADTMVSNSSRG